ncbi:hypothetical protein BKA93DRAFT_768057 [Sparassis latifolia]
MWTLLASLAFGLCAIWSMHFVGMLACGLDVRVAFDLKLTILSAVVAVVFTFAALFSAYTNEIVEKSVPLSHILAILQSFQARAISSLTFSNRVDPDSGYQALSGTEPHEEERRSGALIERPDDVESTAAAEPTVDDACEADDENEAVLDPPRDHTRTSPAEQLPPVRGRTRRVSLYAIGHSRTVRTPPPVRQRSLPPLGRVSEDSNSASTSGSTLSSSSSSGRAARMRSGTGSGSDSSGTTLTSTSWGESMHVGLSRETRMRIKARAREQPLPTFGWKYWIMRYYATMTVLLFLRAAIWSMALVLMHYCGMWAMDIPGGRISWDLGIVVLSYIVAFIACLVACTTMEHMEVHFGRQVAFSTLASLGVCSMHYTGMAAATFYTYMPPAPENAGYPTYLPVTIICVAVFVCVVSNVVLAHSAITARNRMAEMILTKRRLWRIMAEKEAAEQAIDLRQQFISVASHEIRTPLHTVNGYCELLARTDLTDEQTLYVSSVQQACHAINVVAGNVLDFSKLDRENSELSARPVLMYIRKMVEDLAKITNAKGIQLGEQGVDVIMSVSSDVPKAIYLDETYTFRVFMNLLSNAQKFCDQGYICVAVSMGVPDQLLIHVSDTGCGIPKSFRAELFQPFTQADTSLTRPRQGTGLGLNIVKHLVQRMNGSIDVESTEGEGTTFIVKLPITPHTPTHSESPPSSATELPAALPRRLRVVNHDGRTQDLLVHLWTQHGFVVTAGVEETSVQELVRDVDAVWTDLESAAGSPVLRELMHTVMARTFPVYVLYTDSHELSALEPELSEARNVVLVKRPLVMHTVLGMMANPQAHMGTHVLQDAQKVRFAIPVDHLVAEARSKEKFRERGGDVPLDELGVVEMSEKEKILLVEDNVINQKLGRRVLERLGYEVVAANDGKQAIEAARRTLFFCCLMDCQMPVLDGFAATRRIRDLEAEGVLPGRVPIIALTANVTPDGEVQCRQAGMDHFLPKPLKMDDLDAALKKFGRSLPHR